MMGALTPLETVPTIRLISLYTPFILSERSNQAKQFINIHSIAKKIPNVKKNFYIILNFFNYPTLCGYVSNTVAAYVVHIVIHTQNADKGAKTVYLKARMKSVAVVYFRMGGAVGDAHHIGGGIQYTNSLM